MNVEEKRLETFREWPTNAPIDSARLAKAGFYYTGCGIEVQCFLCDAKISDWNYGDQAISRHRLKSPNCPFVLAPSGTRNIPLIPAASNVFTESTVYQNQSSYSGMQQTTIGPSKEYNTFMQRLQSFKNWPISNIIQPKRLASVGFYYLQNKDMVECAFCKGILMNWKLDDDPDSAHRSNFPNCDFYMRRDTEDDLGLIKVKPETITNLTELGIQRHKPQKPEYAMYEQRLHTFKKWPKNLVQTPEMLAEAGFYYTGFEDQVRCFHCDGGLRNWQLTDSVWIEHARWFANCAFINLVCGREFVKYCINKRTPLDLSIFTDMSEEDKQESLTGTSCSTSQSNELNATIGATKTTASFLATLQPNKPITSAEIKKFLETTSIKIALETGLHVDGIKKALKKRMEEVGKSYTDIVQLIQDVLHYQVMEENNRFDNTLNSSTSQLNNLFDQVMQSNSSAHENNIEKSEKETKKIKMINKSDDLVSLREENIKLKEARLCKVCMDYELAVVFLPCGHLATCYKCAPALAKCPLCRLEIRAYVRTFLS